MSTITLSSAISNAEELQALFHKEGMYSFHISGTTDSGGHLSCELVNVVTLEKIEFLLYSEDLSMLSFQNLITIFNEFTVDPASFFKQPEKLDIRVMQIADTNKKLLEEA